MSSSFFYRGVKDGVSLVLKGVSQARNLFGLNTFGYATLQVLHVLHFAIEQWRGVDLTRSVVSDYLAKHPGRSRAASQEKDQPGDNKHTDQ